MKSFIKRKENFICENCSNKVRGTGYTNHCPLCLWSKHVDINPGDRLAECRGMMKPIASDIKNGEYSVLLKCLKCGHSRKNKLAENDNFDTLLDIIKKEAKP